MPMKEFITLKDFFLQHKRRYLWGVLWLLGADSLQLITPRLLGLFTDSLLVEQPDILQLRTYIIIILVLALGIAVFRYLWRIYIIGASRMLEKYLRNKLYMHLQYLSPRFYLQHRTGELMAHLTNDITAVRTSLGLSVALMVDAVFLTVVALVFMLFTVDIRLTLLALIPMPFLALASQRLGLKVYSHFLQVQESFGQLTTVAQENIAAIRVVQSFTLEDVERQRFSDTSRTFMLRNFNLYTFWGLYDPLIYISGILSFVIVIIYGGNLVIQNQITLGDFVAFNGYLGLLTWPMLALGWVVNITQRGRASMQRINRLLETRSEIPGEHEIQEVKNKPSNPPWRDNRELKETAWGDIAFKDVSFRYHQQQNPVLDQVSFSIPRGSMTAIAGRTGSGKTTLLSLLLRFFEPDEGNIYTGEYTLREIPVSRWRKYIGYVPQDNFIFSTTIAENIAFSRPDATMEEIRHAASMAVFDQEIERFPNGYHTAVGERGVTLSGGQQQRLSLARAILAGPEYLVLDDALSSVDISTEEQILTNLTRPEFPPTIIIVSHRLKVFEAADKILVLENGRVEGEGSHPALFKEKGLYYRLCEDQYWDEIMR